MQSFILQLAQTWDGLHGVKSGRLIRKIPRSRKSAQGIAFKVIGVMGDFQPLSQAAEDHRMAAWDVAGAQGMKGDLRGGSAGGGAYNLGLVPVSFSKITSLSVISF